MHNPSPNYPICDECHERIAGFTHSISGKGCYCEPCADRKMGESPLHVRLWDGILGAVDTLEAALVRRDHM